jgi:hypothetical protein
MQVSVGFVAAYFDAPEFGLTRQLAGPIAGNVRELARMNDPHGIYVQCLQCKVF